MTPDQQQPQPSVRPAAETQTIYGANQNPSKPADSKKKLWLVIIVVVLLALGGGGAAYYMHGQSQQKLAKTQASSYTSAYQKYLTSDDFKDLKNQLTAFTTDRGGILESVYTCQLTADELLHPQPINVGGSPSPYDQQLTDTLININRATAKAKTSQPTLVPNPAGDKVQAYVNAKQKATKLNNLFTTTVAVVSDDKAAYCKKLYSDMFIMHVITDYTPGSLSLDDVTRFYSTITTASQDVHAQPVPVDFKATAEAANVLLQTYGSDMSVLVVEKKANNTFENAQVSQRFATELTELDGVLSKAATAGKDTSPTPTSLLDQLNQL